MPRPNARQRVVFCDCRDCIDRQAPTVLSDESLAVADAVAQQVPPPKALLIVGTGLLRRHDDITTLEDCSLPHLDKAANEGCVGFSSVRKLRQEDQGLLEFSQVLGVSKELQANDSDAKLASLAQRFKGMQTVGSSTSPSCQVLLQRLGCAPGPLITVMSEVAASSSNTAHDEAVDAGSSSTECLAGLVSPTQLVDRIVQTLDPGEGTSGPDMLIVHVDRKDLHAKASNTVTSSTSPPQPSSSTPDQVNGEINTETVAAEHGDGGDDAVWDAACEGLLWIDKLVSQLLQHKDVRERVLLNVIVTSHGEPTWTGAGSTTGVHPGMAVQQLQPCLEAGVKLDPEQLVVTPKDVSALTRMMIGGNAGGMLDMLDNPTNTNYVCAVPRPLQSWQIDGSERVDADPAAPALYLRRLPGVVRRDRAEKFTLSEALMKGGMGAVLTDRLLAEVAYKIARAPKYGA